jgi:hypothetical protein
MSASVGRLVEWFNWRFGGALIMSRDLIAILPVVVLSAWACALLLIEAYLPERAKAAVPWLAAAGFVATLVIVVAVPPPVVSAYGGMVEVDGLGGSWRPCCCWPACWRYRSPSTTHGGEASPAASTTRC